MDLQEVKATLRGPMIPVITNLNDDLSIDHGAITANVRYVVERGITTGHGVLLAAGAGGDFPMLTVAERKAVSETIAKAAAGRAPVVVGAQDTNVNTMIEMAQWAEQIGAYAVQMAVGFYYQSSAEDCLRVFQAVHDATSSVGIIIYNTHWEAYNLSLNQVARLAELPRCVALKWSSSEGSGAILRGVARFADQLAVVDKLGDASHEPPVGGHGLHHAPGDDLARA